MVDTGDDAEAEYANAAQSMGWRAALSRNIGGEAVVDGGITRVLHQRWT